LTLSFLCVQGQIKIKSYKGEGITVNYPKTWHKFGAIGHVYFIPKIIRRSTFENELEHVSVNKNVIVYDGKISIEKAITNYADILSRNEIDREYKISKIKNKSKFIYKAEYLIGYNFTQIKYKRVEYFFMNQNNLECYRYQMRKELFDKYHDDAMAIINSIEQR
jgi:hypothetical protein